MLHASIILTHCPSFSASCFNTPCQLLLVPPVQAPACRMSKNKETVTDSDCLQPKHKTDIFWAMFFSGHNYTFVIDVRTQSEMNIMTTLKKMKMKILWGAQGAFGKRKILCENKFLQAIWSVQPWPCRNECFPLEFQCLCKFDKQRVFIQEEKHHYTISMVIPFLIKVFSMDIFVNLIHY